MDEPIVGILFIILALAGVGVVIYGQVSRSQHLLHKWASENQYDLVYAQNRVFRKGPFMWSGKNQVVYRIHVRDERHNGRKGWVRCGGWLLGMLADKVEVRWDS